jgi:hypothetical protein
VLNLTHDPDQPTWEIEEQIRWLEMLLVERGARPRETRAERFATLQELQLEIIRRTSFEEFEGSLVFSDLNEHRDWWKAVYVDRSWPPDRRELEKARDLADNVSRGDTLRLLTPDEASAWEMVDLSERWGANAYRVDGGQPWYDSPDVTRWEGVDHLVTLRWE